ncbi:MAG TPA: LysM peptidoglycan-binding domain-containing protein [Microbacterium sp.]|uniref:LysM peptidoglycan-binding domain-containing protein n=1 Tax=Microbacterium sp. TaxID=51671 RepID=UPI002BA73C4D|nr:LysM peptidoglycan-binding domain-containing protein [Microbacterium sp.]HWI29933.1 LysM peptidoglycan-binding domain-containing protein [Microbacterium sp.]
MTTITASAGIGQGIAPLHATRLRLPARTGLRLTTRTRLRLTARGRRVLAVLTALPAVLALGLAIVAGGSAIAARDDAAPSASFEMVTVSGGDTLWSLAGDIAPAADPRDVVDAIARLNALEDVTITPGQRLAIPAEYAPAP